MRFPVKFRLLEEGKARDSETPKYRKARTLMVRWLSAGKYAIKAKFTCDYKWFQFGDCL